ncbi:MAG: hypothetical protein RR890_02265 [Longicatena sp.]
MIKITPTKTLRGVTISGDYHDFDELIDAIYAISDTEYNQAMGNDATSSLLLSIAYDVRHANMGMRETTMVENGSSGWNLDENNKKILKSLSKENLYYSVVTPYITCFFVALSIDTLNRNYLNKCKKLLEDGYPSLNKDINTCKTNEERALLWEAQFVHNMKESYASVNLDNDEHFSLDFKMINARKSIQVLNNFSQCVWNSLSGILPNNEINSLYDEYELIVQKGYPYYQNFISQYIEFLELDYITLRTKKERLIKLPQTISDIINLGESYKEFCKNIAASARKQNCRVEDLHYDYPEDIKW